MRARDLNLLETATRSLQASVLGQHTMLVAASGPRSCQEWRSRSAATILSSLMIRKPDCTGDGECSAESPIQSIWWDSGAEKHKKPLEDSWVPPLPISLTAWNCDTPPLGTGPCSRIPRPDSTICAPCATRVRRPEIPLDRRCRRPRAPVYLGLERRARQPRIPL
jgi:hypothetical protein